jgi:hypothetical protein
MIELHHSRVLRPVDGDDVARKSYAEVLGMPEVTKSPVLAACGGVVVRRTCRRCGVSIE